MKRLFKIIWFFTKLGLFFLIMGVATLFITYKVMEKDLPSVESIRQYKLQVPLRVYSKDGKLIRVFGSKRRSPAALKDVPKHLINAYIAGEDANFYSHYGIDPKGLFRAVWELITTGKKKTGGSTITMQLTRNVFLTLDQTYVRKLKEIFLAIKLEQTISKDEILELYLNKNFLGHRSYGIVAAADMYYGKTLSELTLAESAMLAAPPKAPSRINPITSPERALQRRNYILRRMLELDFITQQEHDQAVEEVDNAIIHEPAIELNAPWIAEMVRAEMIKNYGDKAYSDGYVVTTTVDSRLQQTAESAVQNGLQAYDKRHGYRGSIKHFNIQTETIQAEQEGEETVVLETTEELINKVLKKIKKTPTTAGLQVALVTFIEDESIIVRLVDGQDVVINLETSKWAKPYITNEKVGNPVKVMADIVSVGDVIMVKRDALGVFVLAQIPRVQGALISLDPNTGAMNALIGGFDFNLSKFNRVTQAKRQPGSGFKPILYSAALAAGLTASTLINDAPIVFDDIKLEKAWRPQNYNQKFTGPMRLREGIVRSKNLVSIRVLDRIGIDAGRNHMLKFGFDPNDIPRNLSISLGTPNVPPLAMARAFSVFANGGYLIDPYLIQTISNQNGDVLYEHEKVVLCDDCEGKLLQQKSNEVTLENDETTTVSNDTLLNSDKPETNTTAEKKKQHSEEPESVIYPPRVITASNQFIIESFMKEVIRRGTGTKALVLKRRDIAGKTGTANEQMDAWFNGFHKDIVTHAWIGFDTPEPMGRAETGGGAALPIWIDFMRVALENIPNFKRPIPAGVVAAKINRKTGELAASNNHDTLLEYFIVGHLPKEESEDNQATDINNETEVVDDIF